MARNILVATVIADGLALGGHGTTGHITTAESYRVFNREYARYWRELVDVHPGYFTEATADAWTANGSAHSLPAAFGRIIAVQYSVSSSQWVNIPEVDRGKVADFSVSAPSTSRAAAYRMDGETVILLPPVTSGSYRVRYYAAPTIFASGDGLSMNAVENWDDFIVHGIAAYCKLKEEADARPYLLRQEQLLAELQVSKMQRAMLTPGTVRDVDEWYQPLEDWERFDE